MALYRKACEAMSVKPRTVRLGYIWNMALRIIPNPMLFRCSMVMDGPSTSGSSLPDSVRTSSSIASVVSSASSLRPWVMSQRGLSGT
jgi:hypothetical protein